MFDIIVIGGGAAGFFSAINCAEKNPFLKIAILEKGKEVLSKVKISGGGRCNLTHAEFIPQNLVKNYPRGEKELLSPFHRFMCGDVMDWFESRGVALKTEEDGRVFPLSNNSQTIIDCFTRLVKQLGIELFTSQNVVRFYQSDVGWNVETNTQTFSAKKLIVTTGSNPKIWKILSELGHTIVPPVPSLFTFNTSDLFIKDLSGIAVTSKVSLRDEEGNSLKIKNVAPLLITHWGFSGPAILKLSAWGARILAEKNYKCILEVNWLVTDSEEIRTEEVISILQEIKQNHPRKMLQNTTFFNLPKRLWNRLLEKGGVNPNELWSEISKAQIRNLAQTLTCSRFKIEGKSTFKEEFVTAGGVSLSEINFKTFESKLFKDLYLAGEIIDVDAITGGFNFQNAWTGGYLISESIG
ncbi:aminoacetone oxidase family FAD-binding enzyme [Capnocytophaga stomatis]|uniref:Aminoacetone oxidase family FAD-binding enzyme n=1 Tax=Capnocytophaga stomatis TaxID=1848904 RepID=A0A250FV76_9FLAO|nr:NAD(P)/FAD-dependent oxidoreductase [Capnocytophaga stomatis]ATA88964.1 aminoacetone oxidase family FAD-binding enzyme [Capnocytophaga stomatis]